MKRIIGAYEKLKRKRKINLTRLMKYRRLREGLIPSRFNLIENCKFIS